MGSKIVLDKDRKFQKATFYDTHLPTAVYN